MAKSKRNQEAYVMIDHRNSPGITPEFIRSHNLDAPAVGAGQTFESAMVVCHCCHGDVILNPLRTRDREYCKKHDAYLCDNCALARRISGDCIPFWRRVELYFKRLVHRRSSGLIV